MPKSSGQHELIRTSLESHMKQLHDSIPNLNLRLYSKDLTQIEPIRVELPRVGFEVKKDPVIPSAQIAFNRVTRTLPGKLETLESSSAQCGKTAKIPSQPS